MDDENIIHDVDIEPSDELELEAEDEQKSDKIKVLREKVKACEAEKLSILEDLQRARADFLNSKRRLEEQFSRDRERIIEDVVTDLLPLIDSFNTAMSDKEAWGKIDEQWRKGIEGIHIQFKNFLRGYKVNEVEVNNKKFDPREHEAVANVPVEDPALIDTVVTVLQKGYVRNGSVIRPAKVAVGIQK